jgi:hypothetical protein
VVDVERVQLETSSRPAHVHEVCTLSKDLRVLWVDLGVCIAQYSKIWFCIGKLARVLHASDVICWICTARPYSELSSVGKRVVALWFE